MLFDPFRLRCGQTLPNRLALAPLTNTQSNSDGLLGDAELAFLARRAEGGFGMVETCAAYVALDGKAWDGELGIDRDACIPGLTRIADRLHAGGAKAIVQLFHAGVRAEPALTGTPTWSASAFTEHVPPSGPPRAATEADITRVIDQFVAAALRAEAAGFDGVELHGAHGYLLCQFLSRTMNTRDDAWGGADLAKRARLLREVTRGVRARCRPDFILGVRLSLEDFGQARGLDLDESLDVSRWLVEDGIDFLHASLWDVTRKTAKRPEQHALPLLREVVARDVAIVTAGKIWTRHDAERVLALGADVVALGRSAILNPDWPQRIARGDDIARPPMTRTELGARAVSPRFQDYLTRWKDFVAD
ncbi:MAG: NADH:flavin oxidoreductase [Kofleriaceae bacterium]|nr:NADH:flavin oxidoreductase [Kofleriaceae bacterium]